MSTVKANTIEPASGGTVTITGAALTTPALGTPASGTLTNCTGLPASGVVNTPAGGISATTVQAALNELDADKFDKGGGPIGGPTVISHSTADTNSVEIRNTSATGYGAFFRGGSSTRYAAQFVNYDATVELLTLSGTGDLSLSGDIAASAATFSRSIGVGMTASAWGGCSAVDIGGSGAIAAASGGLTSTHVVNGAYYNGTNWIYKYTGVGVARYELSDSSGGVFRWFSAPSGTAGGVISFTKFSEYDSAGHLLPGADNTYNHGSGSLAIKQIYTNNSVIVTSDGRLKTARSYTAKERAVARRCRDLGIVYQWNDSIAQKGADLARMHFGTTVQSVIAAFEAEGLDPFRYGVVCYDEWEAQVIEHPAVEAADAVAAQPAVYEELMVDVVIRVNGEDRPAQRPVLVELQPAVPAQPAVQAREAYTETVREAGSRYSLRLDQLAFFIATAGA